MSAPLPRTTIHRIIAVCIILAFAAPSASSYRLLYKEQLFRLYRRQFYNQPLNLNENIYWLEQTLRADFANPLHALARIENERDWQRYRYLFNMHVNLLLVDLYLAWGNRFNRQNAYFFNYPWVDLNLESLERAEDIFQYARIYWDEALVWSERAWQLRFVHLEEVQHWIDQNYRIETGDLDYNEIIDDHLRRLYEVRQQFLDMGPETY